VIFLYRCLGRLPFALLYPLAWLVYLFLYYVAGYRKGVVMDNLAHAFPDRNETEITLLAKNFYRRFAQVALEITRARYMHEEDFRRRVEVLNPDLLVDASEGLTRTVIVLTIHQGNWEWMLHGLSATLGVPLDPIYKPLHSPAADRFMREVRSRFGARPLPLKMAPRDILRNRHRFRLLAIVADQSPIRRERSHWTRFLNRDTAFYPGAEALARSAGCPVIFAQCRRLGQGHYRIALHPLGEPPYALPQGELTERYVRMAERAIREEPESWLWSNRRWKRRRDDEPG
jgi:KDO2-lipid IV(A) lauroyltransferase